MNRTGSIMTKHFDSKPILAMAAVAAIALALFFAGPVSAAPPSHPAATLAQPQQAASADGDQTLSAMQDELNRSSARLELTIPDKPEPARPILYPVPDSRCGCAHDCR